MEQVKKPEESWIKEYTYGAGQEIYPLPIPHSLCGIPFLKATEMLYEKFGGCLFAIGFDRRVTPQKGTENFSSPDKPFDEALRSFDSKFTTILLNPGPSYVLRGNEVGMIISDDFGLAREIYEFDWKSFRGDLYPIDDERHPLLRSATVITLPSPMTVEDFQKDLDSLSSVKAPSDPLAINDPINDNSQQGLLGTSARITCLLEDI
jgi:hypothetical protein